MPDLEKKRLETSSSGIHAERKARYSPQAHHSPMAGLSVEFYTWGVQNSVSIL